MAPSDAVPLRPPRGWRATFGGAWHRLRPGGGARVDGRAGANDTLPASRRHSLTKIGLWLLLCVAVLAIAGANTGNNALYMVVAALLGLLFVAGVVSRLHLGGLQVRLVTTDEIFASSPSSVRLQVSNGSRWRTARQVLLSYGDASASYLDRVSGRGRPIWIEQDALWLRRGHQGLGDVRAMSLFPLGLFRSAVHFRPDREVLVYPQVFAADDGLLRSSSLPGEGNSRRRGRSGDLFGLRDYRRGDDPRSIHWKRSASTGELVLVEREAEESRRVSLIVDNVVPEPVSERRLERFEMLISEAATLGLHALEQGFDVELVTRTGRLAFGAGPRQRRLLLRELALLERVDPPRGSSPPRDLRSSDPSAWSVRLALSTPAGSRPEKHLAVPPTESTR